MRTTLSVSNLPPDAQIIGASLVLEGTFWNKDYINYSNSIINGYIQISDDSGGSVNAPLLELMMSMPKASASFGKIMVPDVSSVVTGNGEYEVRMRFTYTHHEDIAITGHWALEVVYQ